MFGFYTVSEIVGGLYSTTATTGPGLMAGAAIGRIAGRNAAPARAKG